MQHKRIIASALFIALLFSACSTNFTSVKRRISYNSSNGSVAKSAETQTSQSSSEMMVVSKIPTDNSSYKTYLKTKEENNSIGKPSHFHENKQEYKLENSSGTTCSTVQKELSNIDALKMVDQAIEKTQSLQGFNFSYQNIIIYNGSRDEETGNMILLKNGGFLKRLKSKINGISADEIIYRSGGTLYIKNISSNKKEDIYKTAYHSCDELYYTGVLNIKTNRQDKIESKEQQNGCFVIKYQSVNPGCFNDVLKILKFDQTAKINRAEVTYTIKNGYISASEKVFTICFKNNTYQYTMAKTYQNPETPLIINTPSFVKQLG